MRAAVVDERRPGERPAPDDERRAAGAEGRAAPPRRDRSESQSETATTTTPASKPARDCVSRITSIVAGRRGSRRPVDANARAQRRASQRPRPSAASAEQRERVPVPDRSLQPGDPARVVRAEAGNHLAEQCPARGRPRSPPASSSASVRSGRPGEGGGREADDAEREEDDPLGERVPGAVAGDRPPDPEARPHRRGRPLPRLPRRPARSRRGQRDGSPRPPDDDERSDDHSGRPERRRRTGAGRVRRRRTPTPMSTATGPDRQRRGLTASRVGPRPSRATVPPGRVGSSRQRLTIRLPCTHRRLNGSRETCQTLRQPWTPFLSALAASCIDLSSSHRVLRLGLALAAVVMVSGLGARAASTQRRLRDEVVRRSGDRRLVRRRPRDKIYPLECYRAAIKKLPPDVRTTRTRRRRSAARSPSPSRAKPDPGGERSDADRDDRVDEHGRHGDRADHDDEDGENGDAEDGHDSDDRHGHERHARRRTRRARRRCPSRCSCSAGSRCCCSQPARPGYLRRRMNGDERRRHAAGLRLDDRAAGRLR